MTAIYDDAAILLTVRPQYAEAILAGCKTVELRRTRPRALGPGSLVVLYASSPTRAVLGSAEVTRIVCTTPEGLWPQVADECGLTREDFDAYFEGATEAVGIFVRSPRTHARPYPLSEMREEWPGFHPPQAFRYLRSMGEKAAGLLLGGGRSCWPKRAEAVAGAD